MCSNPALCAIFASVGLLLKSHFYIITLSHIGDQITKLMLLKHVRYIGNAVQFEYLSDLFNVG